MAFSYVGKLLKGVRVTEFCLFITVAEENAAETAISYGKTWAIVSGVLSFLSNYIKIVKSTIDVTPDFLKDTGSIRSSGIIDARLGHIILTLLAFLIAFLRFDTGDGKDGEKPVMKEEKITDKAVRS